ncbi:uncharacterized protein LOC106137118 [Amyelois transitella]|uniref:uncharacterized protein LOC106137118 n=1 Tax=Amyelois transitella TaxID=680683 RepID=UPI00298F5809|nr:uncharacterized protein LOC106137118 [Amyelois transitella]
MTKTLKGNARLCRLEAICWPTDSHGVQQELNLRYLEPSAKTFIYTCALWTSFSQRSYDALRVQYNNTFRALFRLPRYCSASGMFADAAIDDFYAIMRKKSLSLIRRVRGSGNRVLRMIADRMDAAVFRRFTELHVTR